MVGGCSNLRAINEYYTIFLGRYSVLKLTSNLLAGLLIKYEKSNVFGQSADCSHYSLLCSADMT